MTKLVIVESPSKAKTITKYLGKGYTVKASVGHIRDLPKKLGVDIENGFQEEYEIPAGKAKVVTELRAAAKNASEIILATDPDREGEAISWHLLEAIKPPKSHAGEPGAVQRDHPRPASPRPWPRPRSSTRSWWTPSGPGGCWTGWWATRCPRCCGTRCAGASPPGRVQSVAVRLIVDREREIQAFNPVEYWVLKGRFAAKLPPHVLDEADPAGRRPVQLGNKETKRRIDAEAEAQRLRDQILKAAWKVTSLETKEKSATPPPPSPPPSCSRRPPRSCA